MDIWKSKSKEETKMKANLKNQVKKLEYQQQRIEDLVINGTFGKTTYNRKKEEINNEMGIYRTRIEELEQSKDSIIEVVTYCKSLLSNLSELWLTSNILVKQKLQRIIFPDGIEFDGKKFRTVVTNKIFGHLHNISTQSENLVSRRGVEPLLQE